jgi:type I phosphodiesterase/nucleotide pyrophosphatase
VKSLFLLIAFFLTIHSALADTPKRAMVLVFDQMRAEYIDRFDLPNFKRAQQMGLNFDNGFVGHLESNTIISHPVITTGMLPGNFAWGSQIMKDNLGLLGPKGLFYMPARLTPQEWMAMQLETSKDSSLIARVKEQNPGPSFAVAQKGYAAFNFGGPYADSIICLGDLIESGPFEGYHKIGGSNVPDYIAQPVGNRFYLEGTNEWGSGKERYGLKGSGYVPGLDPNRPGGDRWVGDVVEQVMQEEPTWSAIFASFGAIDKVSHVLAEHQEPTRESWAVENGINLEETLRLADKELGRILTRLRREGLLEETVIMITADHGGQKNSIFHGRMDLPSHRDDTYYGKGPNFDFSSRPNKVFEPLIASGKVQAMSLDTVILIWTDDLTESERKTFEKDMSILPGVAEVYAREPSGSFSRRFQSEKLEGRERTWAETHNRDLANSLSGPGAPDFIAMLFDNNGYGLIGAHGGAQEFVQRIPMILIAPNLVRKGARSQAWVRLVDVNAIVGKVMGLPPHGLLDGTYEPVEAFLEMR